METITIEGPTVNSGIYFDGKAIFKEKCTVHGGLKVRHIESKKTLTVINEVEVSDDININESIESGWYIRVGGSISVGENILAGKNTHRLDGGIESGWSIRAGGNIESRWGDIAARGPIAARGNITARRDITSGVTIESGGHIEAGGCVYSYWFSILAQSLRTKTLPFYKDFWADMPPLKKWREKILTTDNEYCLPYWEDLKSLVTKTEAIKICSWDGWHWILRAHLEMLFGLKDKHEMKKEDKWKQ